MAITGVFPGVGLTGGGVTGDVYLSLIPAATGVLGGIKPGAGCLIGVDGTLDIVAGGVTAITAGEGLGAPTSGDTITSAGTIKLLPPTTDGTKIGGVKAGTNIRIQTDGEITTEGLIQTNNPYAYNSYIWPVPASPIPAAPGENGSVLTLIDKVTGEIGWTSTGSISGVVAGTGISVTTTAGVATVSLAAVPSITPGSFGATALIPTFSINQHGQIVSSGQANCYPPFQQATVSAPPSLVLDFGDNNTNWEWTLQGNTTIVNPLNAQSGQTGHILLSQNSITPYTVTWDSSWKWGNFSPYPGNPTLAAVDMIQFVVVASNIIVVTAVVQNIG